MERPAYRKFVTDVKNEMRETAEYKSDDIYLITMQRLELAKRYIIWVVVVMEKLPPIFPER